MIFNRIVNVFFDIRVALVIMIVFIIIMVVVLDVEGAFANEFLHFGPLKSGDPNVAKIFGIKITSWTQVLTLYAISFFSGVILNYYSTVGFDIVHSYLYNPAVKKIDNISKFWAYLVTVLDPLIFWSVGILEIFIATTFQLQFLLPGLIAAAIIDIPYGIKNIRKKKFVKNSAS